MLSINYIYMCMCEYIYIYIYTESVDKYIIYVCIINIYEQRQETIYTETGEKYTERQQTNTNIINL